MPPRKVEARLDDMIEEIAGIRALLQGVSFETYRTTWSLRRATERGLEIVAEASRAIPAELQALQPDIPWRQIAGLGNLLRHGYQRTDPLIIWNIVERYLEPLERRCKCCWCISTIGARNEQLARARPSMTPIAPRQLVDDWLFEHHRCRGTDNANL
jgi:uncharacterized protein with HEPN domain